MLAATEGCRYHINNSLSLTNSHDVGFVDGRHAVSLVVSGVFEGVLSDASAGVLSNQFDALNDAVDDLQEEDEEELQSKKRLSGFRVPT